MSSLLRSLALGKTKAAQIERATEWSTLQGEWTADFPRDRDELHPVPVPSFSDAYDPADEWPWWLVCDSCGWEAFFCTEDAREASRASHDCVTWLRERRAEWARVFPTLDADMDGAA